VNARSDSQKADVVLITEANFILDVVFQQSSECERLMNIAFEKDIKLIIPEYAFAEAGCSFQTNRQKNL